MDGSVRCLKSKEDTKLVERRQVTGVTKDGKALVIELMLDSIVDETGTTWVGVLHDVTGKARFAVVS